ncbi:MAG TPA: hypothetical protein VLY63_22220 [Anaerolineae bacterium]|nr:hypothetical protein [Anaerolineae bacterium]
MSQSPSSADPTPVLPTEVQIESVGINPLDLRRVDVAVDLTPCQSPVTVELVIVGPGDDELSSILLVENREWMIDKVMHLRQDAQPGEHILHVGVFHEKELVAKAARRFTFPLPDTE